MDIVDIPQGINPDCTLSEFNFSCNVLSKFKYVIFTDGMIMGSLPNEGTPVHVTTVNSPQPPLIFVSQTFQRLSSETERKNSEKNRNNER